MISKGSRLFAIFITDIIIVSFNAYHHNSDFINEV